MHVHAKGNIRQMSGPRKLLLAAFVVLVLLFVTSGPSVEPYDPELAATLKNLRGVVPPPGMQMGLKQIEFIRSKIPEVSSCVRRFV